MTASTRAIVLSLLAMAVFAVSAPLAAQSEEPQRSPDGAWFATATMPNAPPIPFMDIYTSNPTSLAREGAVLCTLSIPAFAGPSGMTAMTTAGHGNWVRIDKNRFAFTVWRILIDADPMNVIPDGAPVGTAKFWGTIAVSGPDTFQGVMRAHYYGMDGIAFLTVPDFSTAGRRIVVHVE
jgi:hypothetical protein